MRIERVALKHHGDVAVLASSAVTSLPSMKTRPAVGVSSPARMRKVVLLPEPEGPSRAKNSPGSIVEVDPFERG